MVAKPVQVRHSPATVTAPSGSEVRSPTRRRRSSLREKGQAKRAIHRLTPGFTPKPGGRPFPTLFGAPRGRTLARPLAAARALVLASRRLLGRPLRPRRRSRRSPRCRPTPPTVAPTAAPTPDPGARRSRPRSPTTRARGHDPGRTHGRSSRSRRPPPRPCSRSGWATGSWARSRTSRPTRPRPTAVPEVAKFGSVDVEKIVALGADLVIAGGNNFNPPDDIAKLRDLGIPVLVVYAPDVEGRARGHRADRPGHRHAGRGREDRRAASGRVRPGRPRATAALPKPARLLRAGRDQRLLRAGARRLPDRDDRPRRRRRRSPAAPPACTRSTRRRSSPSTRR